MYHRKFTVVKGNRLFSSKYPNVNYFPFERTMGLQFHSCGGAWRSLVAQFQWRRHLVLSAGVNCKSCH